MKRLVVTLMVLVLALGATAAVLAASEEEAPKAKYLCGHCKVGSEKPGKCPICEAEMKAAGTYICTHCDTSSDKAGKCPCGEDYVKAELAGKKCPHCGYMVAKDAKDCGVCKKKHEKNPH